MEVRIATFNIFWFPSSSFIGNRRSEEDREKIREVIKRLDADILVFQEILDLEALEGLLSGLIPGRSYCLRDQAGHWAASTIGQKQGMKVPLAFDSNKLELLEVGSALTAAQPPAPKGRRDPVAARLRPLGGGPPLTVIGVHLKSGVLTASSTPSTPDDVIRVEEMARLTEWIKTSAPITPGGQARPIDEPTVLIGDFNAVRGNAALNPLSPAGALASYSWPEPRFASTMLPSPVEVNLPLLERWTTHLDRKVIDHVILSPEVKLIETPWVYAFDRDDSWLQAAGVSQDWLEEMDYTLKPKHGSPGDVENLHRVSDHRPVRVSVELT
jgi:endonuclease/exonuclease/phosphatase family metal-dependent hydrolase